MSSPEKRAVWRFHIRWRWTLMVGFTVATTVLVLMLILLDVERDAWLDSQEVHAEGTVDRLAESLKIPLLSGSSAEVDVIVRGFMKTVPAVTAVYVQSSAGKSQSFGDVSEGTTQFQEHVPSERVIRMQSEQLWFAKGIQYAATSVGTVAVRYSEDAWQSLSQHMLQRMLLAASVVILFSTLLVYWVAGRISKPMEALADAAERVAKGDYSVKLATQGNDEVSDAMQQFNHMVNELAHKEKIRDAFGKYLNPKLVTEVFKHGTAKMVNHRQEVTVVFADMVGFTAFSESSSPEHVVDVLNQHFEVFHRIIDYFGGHVDKYIGDAVMAVFNHPTEDEEHVSHAVMASLAMARACAQLGVLRQNGEKVSFRVGLNAGDAIVGSIGADDRLEYTVIGDTVNVASRMCGLGAGGEVVLPRASFDRLSSEFLFDTLGEQKVKGVSDLLECGRVTLPDADLNQQLNMASALAFDLTLPVDMRAKIGALTDE